MAPIQQIKVLERCQVSPPPGSVASTILPLTFLDIPWLLFPPTQPLFFYDFPHTPSHFKQTILSNFKTSLSSSLLYFFPFAGKLIIPQKPAKPHLSYTSGDSVSLTIAESTADFNQLSGYNQRGVQDFHQLVPQMPKICELLGLDQESKYSLLAVQITIFPECGISIGFSLRHVAADERTFNNFLKTWATIFRTGLELYLPVLNKNLPYYDRSVIRDTNGLEPILWKQWWNQICLPKLLVDHFSDMVRSTFVMGRPDMDAIKGWIMSQSDKLFGSVQLLLSPYVITCSYIWVCWLKANMKHIEDPIEKTEPHYFGFIAGGITRLGYPVPVTYVGNCIAFGRAMARRNELLGENGIVFAAKAIGDTIKELDRDVLGGAENWISDWNVIRGSGLHITVTGSPKVDLYTLDLGWGGPKKIEEISIDRTGSVSLCESREMVGGIEIGLALPLAKMEAFRVLYNEGLKNLP
ncbi:PREDICTED: malonyl-coenzyme A:anthocyanin 3-O-glucoside-6''-O-malonyltransferase-like [Nicotiana attenuata]|uniref:Coumaroyl-coa:anthocyanidin 3-o-glucoside-6''-o-coumaroyltransferase 2 n=1 Tax=Nicotiana attenuata TaxID=49451 RepID=A0A1J6J083_NICAT|nr:PREDICTED: malonyl-coenzyme A:anthocyanin 3-O-glucoside-6''-O-malonyltransferase-like [Nicotiana attenuata]OIT00713.1 coumaroyl-coa:anthocyanidin 3-o-glucoside-6''-o-coumaroyltransferase 2 [Nicotiana attenuata]